jgi:hypothetical protein
MDFPQNLCTGYCRDCMELYEFDFMDASKIMLFASTFVPDFLLYDPTLFYCTITLICTV